MDMQPYRGMEFWHNRIIDQDGKPARCTVSSIRDGVIYYRVGDEKVSREYVTADRWPIIASPTTD